MPITGLSFLLFALAAVVLYYLFPKRLRQYVLLAASILFYLTYGVRMAGYLAATILLTYLFGLWLDRLAAFRPAAETKEERKRQKRANDRKKRRVLALSLVLNFASLALLKYGGFLAAAVNSVLGTELPLPHFLLPLGISFYIFQTSAYLIDISRGKHRAERGFLRYALFVCYFPQLVQGPINRFADLQPQLTEGNDFSWDNIQHGFLRMLYGVLKKAMIADTLAPIVAKIYGGYAAYPGIICFLGAALYCIQLYCDFSGGIDLMMGISRLFGISMQENFCRPYFSVSLSDFWRRWHISLGEWMKDYLFYPLAVRQARAVLPPPYAAGCRKVYRAESVHVPRVSRSRRLAGARHGQHCLWPVERFLDVPRHVPCADPEASPAFSGGPEKRSAGLGRRPHESAGHHRQVLLKRVFAAFCARDAEADGAALRCDPRPCCPVYGAGLLAVRALEGRPHARRGLCRQFRRRAGDRRCPLALRAKVARAVPDPVCGAVDGRAVRLWKRRLYAHCLCL